MNQNSFLKQKHIHRGEAELRTTCDTTQGKKIDKVEKTRPTKRKKNQLECEISTGR